MNQLFKEFKKILIQHLEFYPLMQAEDIYKLAYQFSFGPAHFFFKSGEAERMIFEEAKGLVSEDNTIEIVEVGNGYYRYPLIDNPIYLNMVCESFIKTVKLGQSNNVDFPKLLNDISTYLKDLKIDFDYNDFIELINKMKGIDYPAISHSDKYRKAYQPHYRLIKEGL